MLGYGFDDLQFVSRAILALQQASDGNIGDVSSVSGRALSLAAGFQVLVEHPLGSVMISMTCNAKFRRLVTLHSHSTLVAGILLWSLPVGILVFIYLMSLWWRLISRGNRLQYPVLYILTVNVFWGGPFLDYAFLFVIVLFLSLPINDPRLEPSISQ